MSNWFRDRLNTWFGTPTKLTDANGMQFFIKDGIIQWESCDSATQLKDIYETCAPVSSIIDSMSDAFVNGEIQAYNVSAVRKKQRDINKEWQALLDNPNWLQDGSQFFKQIYAYRKMFGYCYVIKMKAAGFDKPTSLWCLPPWLLTIEYHESGLYLTDRKLNRTVKLKWGGKDIVLNSDDLILFTDTTNVFNQTNWLPLPRIYTKQYSLTLIKSILEAETTLIQNKGALGIISSAQQAQGITIPLSKEHKDDLQTQWSQYGLQRNKWQMMFSNANIAYTPLVFDSNQLQLKEGYLNAIKDICDGLNYPFQLSAHSDQSTYNNVVSADKRLYQNAIIPDAKSIFKTLEQGLIPNDINVRIDVYYDHIAALQENKKDEADARRSMNMALKIEWDNGLITKNMWLEELGEDMVTGNPLFDKYKFELTPEELGIINTGNGNNQTNGGQGSNSGNQINQGNGNQN